MGKVLDMKLDETRDTTIYLFTYLLIYLFIDLFYIILFYLCVCVFVCEWVGGRGKILFSGVYVVKLKMYRNTLNYMKKITFENNIVSLGKEYKTCRLCTDSRREKRNIITFQRER